ncbi:MAG TPA: hypothetical protein VFK52_08365 [Nocardioidaceae bacterium]|nr:hypothetical protein [Nocardioidaceae bacterium]
MTERFDAGDLPPDLPPEYAEAYLRGYERARAGEPGFVGEAPPALFADDVDVAFLEDVEPEPWYGPTHRVEQEGSPGWLLPAVIGTCVLALVLGAYGLGRLFSDKSDNGTGAPIAGEQTPDRRTGASRGNPWEGDVRALSGLTAVASCVLPPGTDAAGRRVTYDAVNSVDEDYTTAWRCGGAGRGVRLTLELGRRVLLGELALVPGYAKTDPESGTDRYAENNRITKIRWTFANGRSVVQTLDGSPVERDLQFLRIPPVETDSVTLEILESVPGPRNTVAISEIVLSETVG